MQESNIFCQEESRPQIPQYFAFLYKPMIINTLCVNCTVSMFSLDVKCGILGRNMTLIGSQYTSYCTAIYGKLGTNMPSIARKVEVFETPTGRFRSPKAPFSDISRCRMPKKADGVLSK